MYLLKLPKDTGCVFSSPVQANGEPNLQAASGEVRILDTYAFEPLSRVGMQGWSFSSCSESEGVEPGSACAPKQNHLFCMGGHEGKPRRPTPRAPRAVWCGSQPLRCSHRSWGVRYVSGEAQKTWFYS